jgi:hypothetical protein
VEKLESAIELPIKRSDSEITKIHIIQKSKVITPRNSLTFFKLYLNTIIRYYTSIECLIV